MLKRQERSKNRRRGRYVPSYTGLKRELGRCRRCGSFQRGQSRHSRSQMYQVDEPVSDRFSQPAITDSNADIRIDGGTQENPDPGSVSEPDSLVCECCGSDRLRDKRVPKDRGIKAWPLKILI